MSTGLSEFVTADDIAFLDDIIGYVEQTPESSWWAGPSTSSPMKRVAGASTSANTATSSSPNQKEMNRDPHGREHNAAIRDVLTRLAEPAEDQK